MLFRLFILAGLLGLASSGCGGCDGGGFPVDGMVDGPPLGTVTLAWSVTDQNNQPIQCDQVGATTVSVLFTPVGKQGGEPDSFSCKNSPSTSVPLEPGPYAVALTLNGLTGMLATAQSTVTVEAGDDKPPPAVTFVVDAQGSLALSLATPKVSNCKPTTMMGAGITGVTITLVHTGDGCAPVTFTRTRGATVLGSYVVNCSSPMIAPCIENDETLNVASMPSGPYTIHIVGKIGASDCWKNDDDLQVPPLGQPLRRTLNLASQGGSGC